MKTKSTAQLIGYLGKDPAIRNVRMTDARDIAHSHGQRLAEVQRETK